MFHHIYSFHFGIIVFVFYMEVFLKKVFLKISQNSQETICTGVSFLSDTSNFNNEDTPTQYFPKPLTVFAKTSIADVRLCHRCGSVYASL